MRGDFQRRGGHFRGKVYAELVLDITGESLYAEWLPPETVRTMYRSFMDCIPQEAIDEYTDDRTIGEILELRKFFKVCSERGLGLLGWS